VIDREATGASKGTEAEGIGTESPSIGFREGEAKADSVVQGASLDGGLGRRGLAQRGERDNVGTIRQILRGTPSVHDLSEAIQVHKSINCQFTSS